VSWKTKRWGTNWRERGGNGCGGPKKKKKETERKRSLKIRCSPGGKQTGVSCPNHIKKKEKRRKKPTTILIGGEKGYDAEREAKVSSA